MKCVKWVDLGWLGLAFGRFREGLGRRDVQGEQLNFLGSGQKRGLNLTGLDWRHLQRFGALSHTQKKRNKTKKTHTHIGKFGKTHNKFGLHSVFICWLLCTKFIYISPRRICHFLWRPN